MRLSKISRKIHRTVVEQPITIQFTFPEAMAMQNQLKSLLRRQAEVEEQNQAPQRRLVQRQETGRSQFLGVPFREQLPIISIGQQARVSPRAMEQKFRLETVCLIVTLDERMEQLIITL